jgi:SAM domain (Sterile alpha motif)
MIQALGAGAATDTAGWLRGLGLGQYEAAFRENKIDAGVLADLTAEDLKELGVATRRPSQAPCGHCEVRELGWTHVCTHCRDSGGAPAAHRDVL